MNFPKNQRLLITLAIAHILLGLLHVLVLSPLLAVFGALSEAGTHQGRQRAADWITMGPLMLYGLALIVAGIGLLARRSWAALLAIVLPIIMFLAAILYRPPVDQVFTSQLHELQFNLAFYVTSMPWLPLFWLAIVLAVLLGAKKSFA